METIEKTLSVLDPNGDTTIKWNPRNEHEVKAAKELFDNLKKKGFYAYTVEDEETGELIKEFDPELKEIIMSPKMVGG